MKKSKFLFLVPLALLLLVNVNEFMDSKNLIFGTMEASAAHPCTDGDSSPTQFFTEDGLMTCSWDDDCDVPYTVYKTSSPNWMCVPSGNDQDYCERFYCLSGCVSGYWCMGGGPPPQNY